jgi:alkylated DNA repair protein (DNA oxidative demethylase)
MTELTPGAVHLPRWLDHGTQVRLVEACRVWSAPPAGLHRTAVRNGWMSVRTVCLGWQWVPYRYQELAPDGTAVKPFPAWLGELSRRAVAAAYGPDSAEARDYAPDVALVNFYDADAAMGLHQDKDERSLAPVVSFSLGDSCRFRLGNTETRTRPWTDLLLDSGDLFVFGGPSRMAYHGVRGILAGTGPDDIGLPAGRLNITVRESGLAAPASG